MIFSLKNVGIIEKAEIEVKGLTVIAGLNDTGKSFIGKTIFSVIKTIAESSQQELNDKIQIVDQSIRSLIVNLRPYGSSRIDEALNALRNEVLTGVIQKVPNVGIINSIRSKKLELQSLVKESVAQIVLPNRQPVEALIESTFLQIEGQIKIEKNDRSKFISYFDNSIIQDLFKSQINRLNPEITPCEITGSEGKENILRVKIANNRVLDFEANPEKIYYADATLIESPIVIQLATFLTQISLSRRNPFVPMHYTDLVRKLIYPPTPKPQPTIDAISNIIKGKVLYDEQTRNFIFQKPNGQKIDSSNVATGIKSFGVIQLLINSNQINPRSILIIDEPEVHLHPTWEIEYAKLIVTLAKEGIPIVISSHSPYFLKSIVKYVKERDIEQITKYYFGENNGVSSIFKDVTNDITPIYTALAKPMKDLMD